MQICYPDTKKIINLSSDEIIICITGKKNSLPLVQQQKKGEKQLHISFTSQQADLEIHKCRLR